MKYTHTYIFLSKSETFVCSKWSTLVQEVKFICINIGNNIIVRKTNQIEKAKVMHV